MAGILLNRNRQVPAEETPAFGGIAERFRRAGDLDRAIALCRDGLKRFPDQLSARVTLGWCLLDKGQYDLARTELEQVLRKAPDNLAAIRGLAELHDRTEGSLPPEEERSWTRDDAGDTVAASAPAAVVPPPDRIAPVPVSVSSGTVELMSTAAYAEQAAEASAAVFEPTAGLTVEPVELERPAAASMAAVEPSSYFADDQGETLAFDPGGSPDAPVPFEVAGVEPVQVEIETAGAAALSGLVPIGAEPVTPVSFDAVEVDDLLTRSFQSTAAEFVAEPAVLDAGAAGADEIHIGDGEIDWAGLADLTSDAPSVPAPEVVADESGTTNPLAAFSAFDDAPVTFGMVSDLAGADDVMEGFGHVEEESPALSAMPAALDDIDEAAGQDLADAIKALEHATKRVTAHLGPRPFSNEPATAPHEIASYDFGSDSSAHAVDESPASAALSASAEGRSFELVAPDLMDVTFGLEPSGPAETVDGQDDWVLDAALAEVSAPGFDFDAVAPDVSAVAAETAAEAELPPASPSNTFDEADAIAAAAVDAEAAEAETSGVEVAEPADFVPAEVAERDGVLAVAEVVELDEVADVDLISDNVGTVEPEVAVETALVETTDDTAADTEVPAGEAEADGPEPAADAVDEDLPLAAMVATEAPLPAAIGGDSVEAALMEPALTDPVLEPAFVPMDPVFSPDPEPLPARHVYDSPVLGAAVAAAAFAEVAAIVADDDVRSAMPMGQVTSVRSPLAALERFLRQVQARQLELRGETVA